MRINALIFGDFQPQNILIFFLHSMEVNGSLGIKNILRLPLMSIISFMPRWNMRSWQHKGWVWRCSGHPFNSNFLKDKSLLFQFSVLELSRLKIPLICSDFFTTSNVVVLKKLVLVWKKLCWPYWYKAKHKLCSWLFVITDCLNC